MDILFHGTIHSTHQLETRSLEFSPLDLFVVGHHTHGPVFGFATAIDTTRFTASVRMALDVNPEMGVAIEVGPEGRHVMRTGAGIELKVQRCGEPLPRCSAISTLALRDYPLAHEPINAQILIEKKLPLLGFCITYFNDGRCTLGVRTTHSHIDGFALIQFLINLSEIYNGGQAKPGRTGRNNIAELGRGDGDCPSKTLHLIPVDPTQVYSRMSDSDKTEEPLRFAHNQIVLDQGLFSDYVEKICREKPGLKASDVICALAWKAWSLSAAVDSHSVLYIYSIFNLRQVAGLGIGENYQGNAVIDRRAALDRSRLQADSVAEIASLYRQQVKPLRENEVAKDIAYLVRHQRDGNYGPDGIYKGFMRSLVCDMFTKQALNVNDLRFLPLHKIKFDSNALWYESGQDISGIQGYVEVSRRYSGDLVFHYHSLAEEADQFEWELRRLVRSVRSECCA